MRLAAFHLCIVAVFALSVLPKPLYAQALPRNLQFDFGPDASPPAPGFIRVNPSTRYSKEQSFGLLTESLTPVERPALRKALGPEATDGLAKEGPVDFRVDVPPGEYVVEVVMDGGALGTWHGEISVNGTVLVSTLESFGYSAETEYAPPFWACLRTFETSVDHVILRVHAYGQRTAISSVTMFPFAEAPVKYVNGIFLRTAAAKAPNIALALQLINAGKVTDATRIIDAIPAEWSVDRAHLLMALASRLETQTPRQLVESAFGLLSSEYARTHDVTLRLHLRLAELYLRGDQQRDQAGWQWARDLNGMGIFGNCEIAGNCFAEVAALPQHPLWLGSVWQLARTTYWLWVEQHVDRMIVRADSLFRIVQGVYPDHPLVKAYLADSCQSEGAAQRRPGVPRWAQLQNVLVNRLKGIIHYWCDNRQASNGEFGGKYDDDVEMLRWWPFARVGIDDSLTLVGMRRLANGIWNSDWIANGWCKQVRDVEHSSEPVADTQPMMIAFEYGNPVYVERCMKSVKLALDLWTAKNRKGHRHFRSSWYSSTAIDTKEPKDCDVPYNTRTVKAIRWFAWYTHHPEALRFLREWADAWLDDCLRTEKGKAAGVVPAAIRFSDDAIGGHADNWHHPGLFWNYFNYDGGNDILMEFLSCYQLFGDTKYLKPIELSLELVRKHAAEKTKQDSVGSEAWAASKLRRSTNFWEVIEIWRFLTGNTKFDALLLQYGSAYLRYRLTENKSALEEQLTALLREVDRCYPLITTEGYFTDRIEIRDLRGRDDNGAALLESMYLGAPLASLFYPSSAVFWKGTDTTFSALVEKSSSISLRIRTYNHSTVTASGNADFLQLAPGEYEIVQGRDENGDGAIDSVRKKETILLTQRNAFHPFTFAPRQEELIVVRQKKSRQQEQAMCDLAVTAAELQTEKLPDGKVVVSVPVHNIGTMDATDVEVKLASATGGQEVLNRLTIPHISAPLDLIPRQESASFTIVSAPGRYTITVSGRREVSEITGVNNTVEFSLE